MTNTHGGARPNAGRKSMDDADKMLRATYTLPAADIEELKRIGGGYGSRGVRIALAHWRADNPPAPVEVQIWRRKADGALFSVLLDGGIPIAAQPIAEGAQSDPAAWDGALSDQMAEREGEYERATANP